MANGSSAGQPVPKRLYTYTYLCRGVTIHNSMACNLAHLCSTLAVTAVCNESSLSFTQHVSSILVQGHARVKRQQDHTGRPVLMSLGHVGLCTQLQ